MNDLMQAGSANVEMIAVIIEVWTAAAATKGINLSGFDPTKTLEERLLWARSVGLEIGAALSRFSTKLQCSTEAQIREILLFAASNGIYVPPEFVCVDEAVSGRKSRRDGLTRMKAILTGKFASILLVYKVSRLFRVAYKGFQFFQEDVVEQGLRAISTSQGIDTADDKKWRPLAYLNGILDEMLLGSIADHVRTGIKSLFLNGYVTGALTVGYRRKEVSGQTKNGLTRTVPEIDPETAKLIVQHYEWIRDGMSLAVGLRRWNEAGGPVDPRSTVGHMTHHAYRRLLTNPRYIGLWAFGEKRNRYLTGRDYSIGVPQPESEISVTKKEELRIVSDELFHAVQARMNGRKNGPHGPKKHRDVRLADLVVDCFHCGACHERFYVAGVGGRAMKCKCGDLCPQRVVVERHTAVRAVCTELASLIASDAELVVKIVSQATEVDGEDQDAVMGDMATCEKAIGMLSRKIEDLTTFAGEGSAEDREMFRSKIRQLLQERSQQRSVRAQLEAGLTQGRKVISAEEVRNALAQFGQLLEEGGSGRLGAEMIYKAASVFRQLVGGRIDVHAVARPGRKRPFIEGVFRPTLLNALQADLGDPRSLGETTSVESKVWLRTFCRTDSLSIRAHQLLDVENLTYDQAVEQLQAEGHTVTKPALWQCRQRYYEMIGQPAPRRPYNGGKPRIAPSQPDSK